MGRAREGEGDEAGGEEGGEGRGTEVARGEVEEGEVVEDAGEVVGLLEGRRRITGGGMLARRSRVEKLRG